MPSRSAAWSPVCWTRNKPRRRNWPRCTRSAGRSKRPWTSSRPLCAEPTSSCAAKTPDWVRQAFYGLLMAHFAMRALMHEAALSANVDPDRLSFIHAVRVVRRKLSAFNASPPCAEEGLSSARAPGNSAGAGRTPTRQTQSAWRQAKNEQLAASSKSPHATTVSEHQPGNSNR